MDLLLPLPALLASFLLTLIILSLKIHSHRRLPLPPGSSGLPFLGETPKFLSYLRNNDFASFSASRIQKYGDIFSTSLYGHRTVMMNSSSFHRLLFTNENTLVHTTWPKSVCAIVGAGSIVCRNGDAGRRLRSAIMAFLRPEALQKYVSRTNSITLQHLADHWHGKDVVVVYPVLKQLSFAVACDLFVSMTDQRQQQEFLEPFNAAMDGMFRTPISLPWTRYYKAKMAIQLLRHRFKIWAEARREETRKGVSAPDGDLLSCLLHFKDEKGSSLTNEEIADNIFTLLMAGHDTTRSLLAMVFKYMAEHKWCYDEVLREQLAIASGKKAGEPLNWDDLQSMKYTWRVMQETLRVQPVAVGTWRKAIKEIEFHGYVIPKGWMLFWSSNTHHNSKYFPSPEKFDPSRFEGTGPPPYTFVPFGGGPRMCPGNEFAKMVSLVLLHHVVRRYEWSLVDPKERVVIDPMPVPVNGLPIKLSVRA